MQNKQKISIKQLKKDFLFLKQELEKKEVLAVLLYGSHAKNEQNPRSDIDICVVAPKCKGAKKQAVMLRYLWRHTNTNKYDIRLFEELPMHIKASVIKDHKVIYADFSELQEYFYFYRKLWQDQTINWLEKKHL